ncbi:MAG: hypothetical protein V4615_10635 [Bacteroidota bacterium]
MPRKTVRVDIPIRNPNKYTKLIERVWEKHDELGASSPLINHPAVDMAAFEAAKTEALALREEALQLYDRAQSLMEQSRVLLGTNAGQTIYSEGTLYYMLGLIKGALMNIHMGREESLSQWGFNVVVRLSNVGRKRKKVD